MSLLSFLLGTPGQSKVTLHRQPSLLSGKKPVARNNTALAQLRGWRKKGNRWSGPYACRHGTWDGIIERRGERFNVMIKDPPDVVRRHPKWACFSYARKGGWRHINLARSPCDQDVNAIIAYVERVLAESFQRAGKR